VVLASPGMLQNSTSRELFEQWCTDSRNGVIIAGYSVQVCVCVCVCVRACVCARGVCAYVCASRVRTSNSCHARLSVSLSPSSVV
jgi:hypothetical protein